jgi:hypothetical protein
VTRAREEQQGRALAHRREQAAAALDVSVDFFDKWIAPELRTTRVGRLKLDPARELEAWLERNAARTLGESTTNEGRI